DRARAGMPAHARMLNKMRVRFGSLLYCLAWLPIWFAARDGAAQELKPPQVVSIDGLGKGTAKLDGPWQFHVGDNLNWAQPAINDAAGQGGWETILPDRPWGAQGHYAYAGFGWYRLHLRIAPAPGFNAQFQLVLPQIED